MTDSTSALIELALRQGLDAEQTRALGDGLAQGNEPAARAAASALRRLSQLGQVVNTISGTLSLDEMLPRLISLIAELTDAERASLFMHDPETDELFSRVLSGEGVTEIRVSADSGIAGSVFRSGAVAMVPDAYADPRFNTDIDRRSGFRTRDILCVPVRDPKRRVIGVAQVLNRRSGRFDDADRNLLEAIATQAASALESARLYESLERARAEEARLLEINEAISSDLHIDTLLGRIVRATTELLEAERATLFLIDETTNQLWSKVATGVGEGLKEIRIPSDAGIAGAAFTTGDVQNVPDAYLDPRFNQEVDRLSGFRTRNILCLPIIDRYGGRLGVVQILNKRDGAFNQQDVRRLKAFSAQIAIAIANARLFAEVLELKNYNESILKSLSNGVLTFDRQRRLVKINEVGRKLLRLGDEDVEGRTASEMFAGNDWVLKSFAKVAESGGSEYHADSDLKRAGADSVSVNLTVTTLADLQGVTIGHMLIFEDITREKRVKSTMSRYMAKEVVDRILAEGDSISEGTSQVATVLFSDIRKFTTLVESLSARDTVTMLNEYFSEMVEFVFRYGGILDKYIGDAIMATFGAPISTGRDADNAISVANEMMRGLRALNARRKAKGLAQIEIGIGLATGSVLAGSIGSQKRLDYTVIGDSVNLAARLESANKQYGTSILMAGETVAAAVEAGIVRELDYIRVKGKNLPTSIYEALGYHTGDSFPNMERTLARFRDGLVNYRERRFADARKCFDEALALNPGDTPSRLYQDRCAYYLEQPPGEDWDRVWTLTEK